MRIDLINICNVLRFFAGEYFSLGANGKHLRPLSGISKFTAGHKYFDFFADDKNIWLKHKIITFPNCDNSRVFRSTAN